MDIKSQTWTAFVVHSMERSGDKSHVRTASLTGQLALRPYFINFLSPLLKVVFWITRAREACQGNNFTIGNDFELRIQLFWENNFCDIFSSRIRDYWRRIFFSTNYQSMCKVKSSCRTNFYQKCFAIFAN